MPPAETRSPPSNKESTLNISVKGSIIDRQRKLYIEVGDDGHEKTFHVEDFCGLYPSLPIIELTISPSGNNKGDRMNHFVKCCASLFAEISYANDTIAIAPLVITDNSEDSYITDKANLPTNFTKLGAWIMISEGSLVFNKKDKGNNDVYARFHLKSQVAADDIIS